MTKGRAPQVGLKPRACAACGKEFQPYRSHQIACSRRCAEKVRRQGPRRRFYDLICKICGADFTAEWSGMGSPPSCTTCTERLRRANQERKNVARRLATAKDPEERKRLNFRSSLVKYGLTLDEYEAMVAAQKGLCYLCNEPAKPGNGPATQRLHIDHDHTTGKNRKLLCNGCNRGIGYLQDDPELLRRAADYIERFRTE